MKQEMSSADIKNFIAGLKFLIRNKWPTQAEFAKTVTTKVNMSNILREKVGTSQSMRQALAARAGLSVEELIALGRRVSKGVNDVVTTTEEQPVKDIGNVPEYSGKSRAELLNATAGLAMELQSEISGYNKKITDMISEVARERDGVIKSFGQEHSILNALPSEIMAVDWNMKLTGFNRAMMKNFFILPGDSLGNDNCLLFSEIEGMVNKVFNREGAIRKLILHDHDYYGITASPIIDPNSWAVTQVVVSVTPASPWLDLLEEAGWMPPVT